MKILFLIAVFLSALFVFAIPDSYGFGKPKRDYCEVEGTVIKAVDSKKILIKVTMERVALDQIGDHSCRVDGFPYNRLLVLPDGTNKVRPGQRIHALMSVRKSGEYKIYTIIKNLGK